MLALGACSSTDSVGGSEGAVPVPGVEATTNASTPPVADTDPADTDPAAIEPANTEPATADTSTTTPDASTTSTSSTSTSSTTTTSTTIAEPDAFDPSCVVEVAAGDSLTGIIDGFEDETISLTTLRGENGLSGDTIYPGQLLDICVENGLDDVTGVERTEPNPGIVEEETRVAIKAQQTKLNELFANYGVRELLVDGVSGPVTRQRLCAVRLGLGMDVSLTDMEPGGAEEQALMASEKIGIPYVSNITAPRWMLIDRTCQVMFAGQGPEQLDFVFPVSTGEEEFETRDQNRSRMFRYDPALGNDGWHNSTDYPVPIDNPLNGNMYKPMYFDGGQAIHGANNVPTTPQSKGCVRLRPENQDIVIDWLGLTGADGPTNSPDRINAVVNVQGEFPG